LLCAVAGNYTRVEYKSSLTQMLTKRHSNGKDYCPTNSPHKI
jgi:hypothetical protein